MIKIVMYNDKYNKANLFYYGQTYLCDNFFTIKEEMDEQLCDVSLSSKISSKCL